MHRTNIYLTAEEEAALDARARIEGVSRSKVLRDIIDGELGLHGTNNADAADALLLECAAELAEHARRMARSDPDLRSA